MSRFINIGGMYLNLDHVRVITDHEDGTCTVITDDGVHYTNVDFSALDFQGKNVIQAVIPCKGISAYMEQNGRESYPGVRYMCLMESGDLVPLNLLVCDHGDSFTPDMEYRGLIVEE